MILAFVHLGTAIPEFLQLNITRTLKLFPDVQVRLICDSHSYPEKWTCPFSPNFKILLWSRNLLTEEEVGIIENLDNDSVFRKGYWTHTIERLFALSLLFEESKGPVLHIESDILLFPDFPWSRFEQDLPALIWGSARTGEDIGAIFYVSNGDSMKKFVSSAFRLLTNSPRHTDMSLLYEIRQNREIDVGIFPYFHESISRKTESGEVERDRITLRSVFGGYFDIAPLGIWLTGIDPRNTYGFQVLRDEEHLRNSGYYSVVPTSTSLLLDEKGCLKVDDYPIYTLHIHAKINKLFSEE